MASTLQICFLYTPMEPRCNHVEMQKELIPGFFVTWQPNFGLEQKHEENKYFQTKHLFPHNETKYLKVNIPKIHPFVATSIQYGK